ADLRRQLAGGRQVVADEPEAGHRGRQDQAIELKAVLALDLPADRLLEEGHALPPAGGEDRHVGLKRLPALQLHRLAAGKAPDRRPLGPDAPAARELV